MDLPRERPPAPLARYGIALAGCPISKPYFESEYRSSKRFSRVNTRHLILSVAFGIGMLGPATAHAQDSFMTTASLNTKLQRSLYHSSAVDRDHSQRLDAKTRSDRMRAREKPELKNRGELIEAFLRWTDRLVTRLDPYGVLDTPFQPAPSLEGGDTPSPIARQWTPIPRVRPVQIRGGYGLVARITF